MTVSPAAAMLASGAAVLLGILLGTLWTALHATKRRAALEQELARMSALLATHESRDADRQQLLRLAEERLGAAFSELANSSLHHNSEAFLRLATERLSQHHRQAQNSLSEKEQAVAALLQPIREALDRTAQQIRSIEKERAATFGSLQALLTTVTTGQQQLQAETRNLVNALRRPEVRGRWGELTLRRVAELAGMVEHCDFIEQPTVNTPDGRLRPDMVVRLPEQRLLVVDAKAPLDAYLEAMEAQDEQTRRKALQRHARNMAGRVDELAAKEYWAQFPESPEFVVLFIPGDQFLGAALGENPALLEEALARRVMLSTPSSLVALLKAVAYGWRQRSLEHNAEEIRRTGQQLYERLHPFLEHMARLGRQLEGSIKAFNEAAGSLEYRVMPGARRLAELGIGAAERLRPPQQVESGPRSVIHEATGGIAAGKEPEARG